MPNFKKPKAIPNQKMCGWKKYMSFFTSRKVPERVGSQFLCRRNLWRHFENTLFLPFLAQNGQKCQISRSQKPSQIKKRAAGKKICHFSHLKELLKEFSANFYVGESSGGNLKIPYFGHFWPKTGKLKYLLRTR